MALGLAMALAGCGFHPLYGDHGAGGDTNAELAQVRVQPIPDRTGQLLYNKLRDRFNPRGKPAEPRYVLEVTVKERSDSLLLDPSDTSSRNNLELTASFQLREIQSGVTALQGRSQASISYDVLDSQYATIVSEQDVRDRATKILSDDISTRVALYFSSGKPASAATQPVLESPTSPFSSGPPSSLPSTSPPPASP
ncbi:MAG TPA: LPS assembly lipoprotein LptE [Hypericibacter adhaerens]|uniref:LPS-assembly lipoprotein n=1 Tax=Hypericibacter adhaerens TaxID=2602016 RepID=A0A5J6N6F4_9PROT|nr:hypothetical protein FRZ61_50630 [Hypericibacter adhaerens]HWA45718.1 LPS assembly lipoprotein LptE [Hypericibacter adhaerens]